MKRNQSFAERGYEEGRKAYSAGACVRDNPYDAAAYPYTDEGLARAGWHNGFRFEWVQAGCPEERWPEAANTYDAIMRKRDGAPSC